jgi:hypothetical protein
MCSGDWYTTPVQDDGSDGALPGENVLSVLGIQLSTDIGGKAPMNPKDTLTDPTSERLGGGSYIVRTRPKNLDVNPGDPNIQKGTSGDGVSLLDLQQLLVKLNQFKDPRRPW